MVKIRKHNWTISNKTNTKQNTKQNKTQQNKTQNKTKQNTTKQNTKQNKTKHNKTKHKTKQNTTKQNTKQNKTKHNKTKQNKHKTNTHTLMLARFFSQSHFTLRVCSLLRLGGEHWGGGGVVHLYTWGFETSLYKDCYGCRWRTKRREWSLQFEQIFSIISFSTLYPLYGQLINMCVFFYVE